MATNAKDPGSMASQPLEALDEEQIQAALKQLKLLHVKCQDLRTAIPQTLIPLSEKGRPEEVYQNYVSAIQKSKSDIEEFQTLYASEQTHKILEQARRSEAAQPKNIKPWRAKDHPDWCTLDEE